jgi:Rab-GTPase-TBC domain
MSSLLWAKLWCKLNVISGDGGALLCVCKTFENLLAALDPKLFLHLLSLNIQPLRIAFSWIQLSFVSFFEIDQLLILWDRVIGFTDLALFSLLAVAIFIYRSEVLLNCSKPEKALLILNEGSGLKVIPLLQMMLFSGK